MINVDELINILLDRVADIGSRDDAAIALGAFDDEKAEKALVLIACDMSEPDWFRQSCGESLGEIWRRSGTVNQAIYSRLPKAIQAEVEGMLHSEFPPRTAIDRGDPS